MATSRVQGMDSSTSVECRKLIPASQNQKSIRQIMSRIQTISTAECNSGHGGPRERWMSYYVNIFQVFYIHMPLVNMSKALTSLFLICASEPGGLLSPKLYVDVPAGPRKSEFLYTNFFVKFPTHQYTIFERRAPNFDQIGCFLQ